MLRPNGNCVGLGVCVRGVCKCAYSVPSVMCIGVYLWFWGSGYVSVYVGENVYVFVCLWGVCM